MPPMKCAIVLVLLLFCAIRGRGQDIEETCYLDDGIDHLAADGDCDQTEHHEEDCSCEISCGAEPWVGCSGGIHLRVKKGEYKKSERDVNLEYCHESILMPCVCLLVFLACIARAFDSD